MEKRIWLMIDEYMMYVIYETNRDSVTRRGSQYTNNTHVSFGSWGTS